MTIQGVYLEPICKETIEFLVIDERFDNRLVVLYEIIYAEVVNGYLGNEDEWNGAAYYHGTSHCGCSDLKIANSGDDRIPVYAWCENAHCCTRSIINGGFLKAKGLQGKEILLSTPLKITFILSLDQTLLTLYFTENCI